MKIKYNLIGLLLLCSLTSCGPGTDFPKTKWNIAQKDSTIVQDFTVRHSMIYMPILDFHPLRKLHTPFSEDPIMQFIGDGSKGIYNLKTHQFMNWNNNEERQQVFAMLQNKEAVWKRENPGTIIPIHLKIEKLDQDKDKVIIDQTYDTEGYDAAIERDIVYIKLKPGKYRLTANTTKETVLPPDLETFLLIGSPPD